MLITNMIQDMMPRGPLNVVQRRMLEKKGPNTRLPVGYAKEGSVSPKSGLSNKSSSTSININNRVEAQLFDEASSTFDMRYVNIELLKRLVKPPRRRPKKGLQDQIMAIQGLQHRSDGLCFGTDTSFGRSTYDILKRLSLFFSTFNLDTFQHALQYNSKYHVHNDGMAIMAMHVHS